MVVKNNNTYQRNDFERKSLSLFFIKGEKKKYEKRGEKIRVGGVGPFY